MDPKGIQGVLEACEFFKGLEQKNLEQIARLCRVEECGPGQYLFRQGDFGDRIYILAEGQVFLERAVDLGTRKGNVEVGRLGKGKVLGCWSTLLGEAHNLMSSACCRKQTRVLVLKGEELRAMMVKDRSFGFTVLERLCFLLRNRIQGVYGAMEKIC